MKKNKFQMPNFEGKKTSSFITKFEVDEERKKIKITRSNGSVDEVDATNANLNAVLQQMEQQVLRFIKKNERLIQEKDQVITRVKLKTLFATFVIMVSNIPRMTGPSQSIKAKLISNAFLAFYALVTLFVKDPHQNLDKFIQIMKQGESFKKIRAYQYYMEHKEDFANCVIQNEQGQYERREILNVNDIAVGNFTLSDLKRIRGEEKSKEKKKVFKYALSFR